MEETVGALKALYEAAALRTAAAAEGETHLLSMGEARSAAAVRQLLERGAHAIAIDVIGASPTARTDRVRLLLRACAVEDVAVRALLAAALRALVDPDGDLAAEQKAREEVAKQIGSEGIKTLLRLARGYDGVSIVRGAGAVAAAAAADSRLASEFGAYQAQQAEEELALDALDEAAALAAFRAAVAACDATGAADVVEGAAECAFVKASARSAREYLGVRGNDARRGESALALRFADGGAAASRLASAGGMAWDPARTLPMAQDASAHLLMRRTSGVHPWSVAQPIDGGTLTPPRSTSRVLSGGWGELRAAGLRHDVLSERVATALALPPFAVAHFAIPTVSAPADDAVVAIEVSGASEVVLEASGAEALRLAALDPIDALRNGLGHFIEAFRDPACTQPLRIVRLPSTMPKLLGAVPAGRFYLRLRSPLPQHAAAAATAGDPPRSLTLAVHPLDGAASRCIASACAILAIIWAEHAYSRLKLSTAVAKASVGYAALLLDGETAAAARSLFSSIASSTPEGAGLVSAAARAPLSRREALRALSEALASRAPALTSEVGAWLPNARAQTARALAALDAWEDDSAAALGDGEADIVQLLAAMEETTAIDPDLDVGAAGACVLAPPISVLALLPKVVARAQRVGGAGVAQLAAALGAAVRLNGGGGTNFVRAQSLAIAGIELLCRDATLRRVEVDAHTRLSALVDGLASGALWPIARSLSRSVPCSAAARPAAAVAAFECPALEDEIGAGVVLSGASNTLPTLLTWRVVAALLSTLDESDVDGNGEAMRLVAAAAEINSSSMEASGGVYAASTNAATGVSASANGVADGRARQINAARTPKASKQKQEEEAAASAEKLLLPSSLGGHGAEAACGSPLLAEILSALRAADCTTHFDGRTLVDLAKVATLVKRVGGKSSDAIWLALIEDGTIAALADVVRSTARRLWHTASPSALVFAVLRKPSDISAVRELNRTLATAAQALVVLSRFYVAVVAMRDGSAAYLHSSLPHAPLPAFAIGAALDLLRMAPPRAPTATKAPGAALTAAHGRTRALMRTLRRGSAALIGSWIGCVASAEIAERPRVSPFATRRGRSAMCRAEAWGGRGEVAGVPKQGSAAATESFHAEQANAGPFAWRMDANARFQRDASTFEVEIAMGGRHAELSATRSGHGGEGTASGGGNAAASSGATRTGASSGSVTTADAANPSALSSQDVEAFACLGSAALSGRGSWLFRVGVAVNEAAVGDGGDDGRATQAHGPQYFSELDGLHEDGAAGGGGAIIGASGAPVRRGVAVGISFGVATLPVEMGVGWNKRGTGHLAWTGNAQHDAHGAHHSDQHSHHHEKHSGGDDDDDAEAEGEGEEEKASAAAAAAQATSANEADKFGLGAPLGAAAAAYARGCLWTYNGADGRTYDHHTPLQGRVTRGRNGATLPLLHVGDFVRVTLDATRGTLGVAINGGANAVIASDVHTNGRPLHACVLLQPGAAVTLIPDAAATHDARGRPISIAARGALEATLRTVGVLAALVEDPAPALLREAALQARAPFTAALRALVVSTTRACDAPAIVAIAIAASVSCLAKSVTFAEEHRVGYDLAVHPAVAIACEAAAALEAIARRSPAGRATLAGAAHADALAQALRCADWQPTLRAPLLRLMQCIIGCDPALAPTSQKAATRRGDDGAPLLRIVMKLLFCEGYSVGATGTPFEVAGLVSAASAASGVELPLIKSAPWRMEITHALVVALAPFDEWVDGRESFAEGATYRPVERVPWRVDHRWSLLLRRLVETQPSMPCLVVDTISTIASGGALAASGGALAQPVAFGFLRTLLAAETTAARKLLVAAVDSRLARRREDSTAASGGGTDDSVIAACRLLALLSHRIFSRSRMEARSADGTIIVRNIASEGSAKESTSTAESFDAVRIDASAVEDSGALRYMNTLPQLPPTLAALLTSADVHGTVRLWASELQGRLDVIELSSARSHPLVASLEASLATLLRCSATWSPASEAVLAIVDAAGAAEERLRGASSSALGAEQQSALEREGSAKRCVAALALSVLVNTAIADEVALGGLTTRLVGLETSVESSACALLRRSIVDLESKSAAALGATAIASILPALTRLTAHSSPAADRIVEAGALPLVVGMLTKGVTSTNALVTVDACSARRARNSAEHWITQLIAMGASRRASVQHALLPGAHVAATVKHLVDALFHSVDVGGDADEAPPALVRLLARAAQCGDGMGALADMLRNGHGDGDGPAVAARLRKTLGIEAADVSVTAENCETIVGGDGSRATLALASVVAAAADADVDGGDATTVLLSLVGGDALLRKAWRRTLRGGAGGFRRIQDARAFVRALLSLPLRAVAPSSPSSSSLENQSRPTRLVDEVVDACLATIVDAPSEDAVERASLTLSMFVSEASESITLSTALSQWRFCERFAVDGDERGGGGGGHVGKGGSSSDGASAVASAASAVLSHRAGASKSSAAERLGDGPSQKVQRGNQSHTEEIAVRTSTTVALHGVGFYAPLVDSEVTLVIYNAAGNQLAKVSTTALVGGSDINALYLRVPMFLRDRTWHTIELRYAAVDMSASAQNETGGGGMATSSAGSSRAGVEEETVRTGDGVIFRFRHPYSLSRGSGLFLQGAPNIPHLIYAAVPAALSLRLSSPLRTAAALGQAQQRLSIAVLRRIAHTALRHTVEREAATKTATESSLGISLRARGASALLAVMAPLTATHYRRRLQLQDLRRVLGGVSVSAAQRATVGSLLSPSAVRAVLRLIDTPSTQRTAAGMNTNSPSLIAAVSVASARSSASASVAFTLATNVAHNGYLGVLLGYSAAEAVANTESRQLISRAISVVSDANSRGGSSTMAALFIEAVAASQGGVFAWDVISTLLNAMNQFAELEQRRARRNAHEKAGKSGAATSSSTAAAAAAAAPPAPPLSSFRRDSLGMVTEDDEAKGGGDLGGQEEKGDAPFNDAGSPSDGIGDWVGLAVASNAMPIDRVVALLGRIGCGIDRRDDASDAQIDSLRALVAALAGGVSHAVRATSAANAHALSAMANARDAMSDAVDGESELERGHRQRKLEESLSDDFDLQLPLRAGTVAEAQWRLINTLLFARRGSAASVLKHPRGGGGGGSPASWGADAVAAQRSAARIDALNERCELLGTREVCGTVVQVLATHGPFISAALQGYFGDVGVTVAASRVGLGVGSRESSNAARSSRSAASKTDDASWQPRSWRGCDRAAMRRARSSRRMPPQRFAVSNAAHMLATSGAMASIILAVLPSSEVAFTLVPRLIEIVEMMLQPLGTSLDSTQHAIAILLRLRPFVEAAPALFAPRLRVLFVQYIARGWILCGAKVDAFARGRQAQAQRFPSRRGGGASFETPTGYGATSSIAFDGLKLLCMLYDEQGGVLFDSNMAPLVSAALDVAGVARGSATMESATAKSGCRPLLGTRAVSVACAAARFVASSLSQTPVDEWHDALTSRALALVDALLWRRSTVDALEACACGRGAQLAGVRLLVVLARREKSHADVIAIVGGLCAARLDIPAAATVVALFAEDNPRLKRALSTSATIVQCILTRFGIGGRVANATPIEIAAAITLIAGSVQRRTLLRRTKNRAAIIVALVRLAALSSQSSAQSEAVLRQIAAIAQDDCFSIADADAEFVFAQLWRVVNDPLDQPKTLDVSAKDRSTSGHRTPPRAASPDGTARAVSRDIAEDEANLGIVAKQRAMQMAWRKKISGSSGLSVSVRPSASGGGGSANPNEGGLSSSQAGPERSAAATKLRSQTGLAGLRGLEKVRAAVRRMKMTKIMGGKAFVIPEQKPLTRLELVAAHAASEVAVQYAAHAAAVAKVHVAEISSYLDVPDVPVGKKSPSVSTNLRSHMGPGMWGSSAAMLEALGEEDDIESDEEEDSEEVDVFDQFVDADDDDDALLARTVEHGADFSSWPALPLSMWRLDVVLEIILRLLPGLQLARRRTVANVATFVQSLLSPPIATVANGLWQGRDRSAAGAAAVRACIACVSDSAFPFRSEVRRTLMSALTHTDPFAAGETEDATSVIAAAFGRRDAAIEAAKSAREETGVDVGPSSKDGGGDEGDREDGGAKMKRIRSEGVRRRFRTAARTASTSARWTSRVEKTARSGIAHGQRLCGLDAILTHCVGPNAATRALYRDILTTLIAERFVKGHEIAVDLVGADRDAANSGRDGSSLTPLGAALALLRAGVASPVPDVRYLDAASTLVATTINALAAQGGDEHSSLLTAACAQLNGLLAAVAMGQRESGDDDAGAGQRMPGGEGNSPFDLESSLVRAGATPLGATARRLYLAVWSAMLRSCGALRMSTMEAARTDVVGSSAVATMARALLHSNHHSTPTLAGAASEREVAFCVPTAAIVTTAIGSLGASVSSKLISTAVRHALRSAGASTGSAAASLLLCLRYVRAACGASLSGRRSEQQHAMDCRSAVVHALVDTARASVARLVDSRGAVATSGSAHDGHAEQMRRVGTIVAVLSTLLHHCPNEVPVQAIDAVLQLAEAVDVEAVADVGKAGATKQRPGAGWARGVGGGFVAHVLHSAAHTPQLGGSATPARMLLRRVAVVDALLSLVASGSHTIVAMRVIAAVVNVSALFLNELTSALPAWASALCGSGSGGSDRSIAATLVADVVVVAANGHAAHVQRKSCTAIDVRQADAMINALSVAFNLSPESDVAAVARSAGAPLAGTARAALSTAVAALAAHLVTHSAIVARLPSLAQCIFERGGGGVSGARSAEGVNVALASAFATMLAVPATATATVDAIAATLYAHGLPRGNGVAAVEITDAGSPIIARRLLCTLGGVVWKPVLCESVVVATAMTSSLGASLIAIVRSASLELGAEKGGDPTTTSGGMKSAPLLLAALTLLRRAYFYEDAVVALVRNLLLDTTTLLGPALLGNADPLIQRASALLLRHLLRVDASTVLPNADESYSPILSLSTTRRVSKSTTGRGVDRAVATIALVPLLDAARDAIDTGDDDEVWGRTAAALEEGSGGAGGGAIAPPELTSQRTDMEETATPATSQRWTRRLCTVERSVALLLLLLSRDEVVSHRRVIVDPTRGMKLLASLLQTTDARVGALAWQLCADLSSHEFSAPPLLRRSVGDSGDNGNDEAEAEGATSGEGGETSSAASAAGSTPTNGAARRSSLITPLPMEAPSATPPLIGVCFLSTFEGETWQSMLESAQGVSQSNEGHAWVVSIINDALSRGCASRKFESLKIFDWEGRAEAAFPDSQSYAVGYNERLVSFGPVEAPPLLAALARPPFVTPEAAAKAILTALLRATGADASLQETNGCVCFGSVARRLALLNEVSNALLTIDVYFSAEREVERIDWLAKVLRVIVECLEGTTSADGSRSIAPPLLGALLGILTQVAYLLPAGVFMKAKAQKLASSVAAIAAARKTHIRNAGVRAITNRMHEASLYTRAVKQVEHIVGIDIEVFSGGSGGGASPSKGGTTASVSSSTPSMVQASSASSGMMKGKGHPLPRQSSGEQSLHTPHAAPIGLASQKARGARRPSLVSPSRGSARRMSMTSQGSSTSFHSNMSNSSAARSGTAGGGDSAVNMKSRLHIASQPIDRATQHEVGRLLGRLIELARAQEARVTRRLALVLGNALTSVQLATLEQAKQDACLGLHVRNERNGGGGDAAAAATAGAAVNTHVSSAPSISLRRTSPTQRGAVRRRSSDPFASYNNAFDVAGAVPLNATKQLGLFTSTSGFLETIDLAYLSGFGARDQSKRSVAQRTARGDTLAASIAVTSLIAVMRAMSPSIGITRCEAFVGTLVKHLRVGMTPIRPPSSASRRVPQMAGVHGTRVGEAHSQLHSWRHFLARPEPSSPPNARGPRSVSPRSRKVSPKMESKPSLFGGSGIAGAMNGLAGMGRGLLAEEHLLPPPAESKEARRVRQRRHSGLEAAQSALDVTGVASTRSASRSRRTSGCTAVDLAREAALNTQGSAMQRTRRISMNRRLSVNAIIKTDQYTSYAGR